MTNPNYVLVMYILNKEGNPQLIGHKTIDSDMYNQFINKIFKTFEAEDIRWTITGRHWFCWETSVMTTFFVIIDAVIQS